MNCSRLSNSGVVVLMIVVGGVSGMTPACGPTPSGSSGLGLSGSTATNTVGNLVGGSNGTGGSNSPDSSGGTTAATPGSGSGGVNAATSTECPAGSETCNCYGNGTCNAGLVCASQLCVNLTGLLGGSTGGTYGNGIGGAIGSNGGTRANATGTGGFKSGNSTGGAGLGGNSTMGGYKAAGGAPATGGNRSTGGASATGGVSFWTTVTYSTSGSPNPPDGHHNPGQNCVQCHVSGSATAATVFLFAGTVYKADGTTPAPNAQVGVSDGTNLYTTYSATNGNFWVPGPGTVNWATAQVRIRNGNGELTMVGATPASTCNVCHNATVYPRITAP